ncbi:hypothetical protein [Kaarinaea lacus]
MINYCSKFVTVTTTIILLATLLVACEIIVPKEYEVKEEEVLAQYKDVPIADVMNEVQKKFRKAKDEEAYFYSPNNYRTARTGLQTARAYFKNPEKRTYVLKSLYRADKALDDAFEVKAIVVRELSEHVKVRDFLDTLEAKKSHSREYRSLIASLLAIIERIEKDKESIFTDPERKKDMDERKNNMMAEMLDFRLRIVKFRFLNHAELLMSEANNYDAKTVAPVTYQQTVDARNSAVKYVTENVENLQGISDVAKKFQYEAERLLHITRAVNTILKLEKDTQEQYVLRYEENLKKIAEALKEPKEQYQSFSAQATRYAGVIKRILREKQELALKVADLNNGAGVANTAEQTAPATQATPAKDDSEKPKAKGLEIVPVSGDPAQLKNSLRILTDQVYQLTVEKTAWENERANLNAQIKKLKTAQKSEAKPKEKPKTKPKPKAESKKEAEKKTEPKPAAEKKEADEPAESKTADKPEESKTTGDEAKTE